MIRNLEAGIEPASLFVFHTAIASRFNEAGDLIQMKPMVSSSQKRFRFLIPISLFLGGVGLLALPWELVGKVGEALIIASVLAGSVDFWLKEKLLREVVEDIAIFLVGYRLPELIQKQILEMMRLEVVRTAYHITYRLTPKDNEMEMDIDISYQLKNYSPATKVYRPCLGIQKFDSPNFHFHSLQASSNKKSYTLTTNDSEHIYETAEVFRVTGEEIEVLPITSSEAADCSVSIRYSDTQPLAYRDVIYFENPALGITLQVFCPPDYKISVGPDIDMKTSLGRWVFTKLFLTGQHVAVRWIRNQ